MTSSSLLNLRDAIGSQNRRQHSKSQKFKELVDYIKDCGDELFLLSDSGEDFFDIDIPGAKIRGRHFTMPSQKEDLLKFYRIQNDVNNRPEAIDLKIELHFDSLGNITGLNNLPDCDTLSDKESVEILILSVIESFLKKRKIIAKL